MTERVAEQTVLEAAFYEFGVQINAHVPHWYNVYQVREAQDQLIDRACDEADFAKLNELCGRALYHPHGPPLPAVYQAKYEIFIAFCQGEFTSTVAQTILTSSDYGRDPVVHVQRAQVMIQRLQQYSDAMTLPNIRSRSWQFYATPQLT